MGLVPQGITFPSKRDAWIVAVIWTAALVAAAGATGQLFAAAPLAVRASLFLLLLAGAAFMLWVLYGTSYTLGEDRLLARSGPFRFHVPLRQIDSVTPSRNPLSSPACSLDRLLIRWDGGRRRILISPDPTHAFLQALSERCPLLEREGSSLTRTRPA